MAPFHLSGFSLNIIAKESPSLVLLNTIFWDFPGGLVVKISPFKAGVVGLIPGWGAKIPFALWPKHQNIKQKQCCNGFNKDSKKGPHQKTFLKIRYPLY